MVASLAARATGSAVCSGLRGYLDLGEGGTECSLLVEQVEPSLAIAAASPRKKKY